jgi:hypothetical protein
MASNKKTNSTDKKLAENKESVVSEKQKTENEKAQEQPEIWELIKVPQEIYEGTLKGKKLSQLINKNATVESLFEAEDGVENLFKTLGLFYGGMSEADQIEFDKLQLAIDNMSNMGFDDATLAQITRPMRTKQNKIKKSDNINELKFAIGFSKKRVAQKGTAGDYGHAETKATLFATTMSIQGKKTLSGNEKANHIIAHYSVLSPEILASHKIEQSPYSYVAIRVEGLLTGRKAVDSYFKYDTPQEFNPTEYIPFVIPIKEKESLSGSRFNREIGHAIFGKNKRNVNPWQGIAMVDFDPTMDSVISDKMLENNHKELEQ